MPRLRTVSTQDPGWKRSSTGAVTATSTSTGRVAPEDVARVKALVIPPAWSDVWISPYPNAHLQAVGTDDAGRRQYLYHPAWRQKRDELKFDRVLEMAVKLPAVRRRIRADLNAEGDLVRDTRSRRRGSDGRPGLLPTGGRRLHRAARLLRPDHPGASPRAAQRREDACSASSASPASSTRSRSPTRTSAGSST